MHNEENKNIRTPRRGPGMRGPGMGGAVEKPKDFKSAIKRLMKELKNFKGVIVFALILAMISAILSIYAPSKLSDLTDKISEGLVVNQDNVKELSEKITSNLSEENLKELMPKILEINLSNDKITKIMLDENVSNEDKLKFREILSGMATNSDSSKLMQSFSSIPDSILSVILEDSKYEDQIITVEDKIILIKSLNGNSDNINIDLSQSIVQVLFKEIEVDGVKVYPLEQYELLKTMNSVRQGENVDANELYSKIDSLPQNIKEIIKPKMDIDGIKNITIFLVCLYVVSALFSFIQSYFVQYLI